MLLSCRTYITSVSRPIGSLTQEENKNLFDIVFIRVISATSILEGKKKRYFSDKVYEDKYISELVFPSYFRRKLMLLK